MVEQQATPAKSTEVHIELVSEEDQLGLAQANLDRLLEWGSRFDAKATAVLAVNLSMLGFLASILPAFSSWNAHFAASLLATAGLLGASLIVLYVASYPKTEAPSTSLHYFGTIATLEQMDYASRFVNRTRKEHLDDILLQCHRNAFVIDRKFRLLKQSFLLLLVGCMPWLFAIILMRGGSA